MEQHWLKGGFPTPLLAKSTNMSTAWYQSFIKNYLELDLPQIGFTVPSLTLYRFVSMLCHNHDSLWNSSNYSKSLGISSNTISTYRDFLEKTYLIRILPPFFTNAKKRIVKSPKVYIRDTGILHHISKINDLNQLLAHPLIGNSWEGYVIEQIINYLVDPEVLPIIHKKPNFQIA